MSDFISFFFTLFDGKWLSSLERNFILKIYPIIKREIELLFQTKKSQPDCKNNLEKKTILMYQEKFDRIVQILDSSDEKGEQYLRYFPIWKNHREENMRILTGIANDLRDIRESANIARISSGLVGIGGGAAILASLAFPPAAPFAAAGTFFAASSAVVTSGTSIVELALSQGSLDDAKNVIAEDRRLMKRLGAFEFFDELNDAINRLFDKRSSSTIFNEFVEFIRQVPTNLRDNESTLSEIRSCLRRLFPELSEFLIIGPALAAVILSISFAIFVARRRKCAILNTTDLGLLRVIDGSVHIARMVAAAGLKGTALGELIPKKLANIGVGVLAGVGIVLDVATVVLSSIEYKNDSVSPEVKMMRAVVKHMGEQLKLCQDLNDELLKRKKEREEIRRNFYFLLLVTFVSLMSVSIYNKIFA